MEEGGDLAARERRQGEDGADRGVGRRARSYAGESDGLVMISFLFSPFVIMFQRSSSDILSSRPDQVRNVADDESVVKASTNSAMIEKQVRKWTITFTGSSFSK